MWNDRVPPLPDHTGDHVNSANNNDNSNISVNAELNNNSVQQSYNQVALHFRNFRGRKSAVIEKHLVLHMFSVFLQSRRFRKENTGNYIEVGSAVRNIGREIINL